MRKVFASRSLRPLISFVIYALGVAAHAATPLLTLPIDETRRVTLEGNTPPAALRAESIRALEGGA